MKGHHIRYSAEEMAWLEENRLLPIADYHAAFLAAFGRADIAAANLHSLRKRKGWKTGRTGQFVKGHEPPNKGVPCAPGRGGRHPNSIAAQFRKGERRGVAVRLYKPIGTERITKDGYRERKIHDGLPLQSRWRAVHLIEWETANGPLPKGMALKCLSGDKTDCHPSNWVLVPRALLPRLAGGNRHSRAVAFDDAPAELKPVLLAAAQLQHAARTARKGKRA